MAHPSVVAGLPGPGSKRAALLTYAPSITEDLLTGSRELSRAFAEAPSYAAQRGDIVVAAGAPAPPVLHIQRGIAFSSYTLPDARRAIAEIFLPFDFIGIEHVVTGRASAEVTAVTTVACHALNASVFRRHVVCNSRIALRVLALIAEQKTRRDRHALALARLDARERLAEFVIGIYDRLRAAGLIARPVFNLPLTQDQIADHLGLTTVHVSRTLKRLRDEQLLITHRQMIIITDLDRLRRTAGELPAPSAP